MELIPRNFAMDTLHWVVEMMDDTKWAGAHTLAGLSHIGLALTGAFYFVFGYKGFDAPFDIAAMLPWATVPCVSRRPQFDRCATLYDTDSEL